MSHHRWRIAGALLLVLTAGALAYAAVKTAIPHPPRVAEVVRAQGFEVVDAKGRVAARLCTEPEGLVWLAVTDRSGRSRATLHLNKEGLPRAAVLDRAGLIRGSLLITPDGYASCHIDDDNQKTRLVLMAGPGGPILNVNDGRGTTRAGLTLDEDGAATAAWAGPDGRVAAAIRVDAQHFPHLGLLHNKQPIWEAP